MVKDNPYSSNISFLISSQIPDHIRSDNPLYDSFMTAYYEWLELTNNPLYISEHLPDFTDIDRSPDYFLNHTKNEILSNFPDNIVADKALLLRFAKDFYERKGTLSSYKFLFKALYNEDVEIELPKEYILRASDGQWKTDSYILTYVVKGDPFTLINDYLYTDNGDILFVDNVIFQNQGNYNVYKIYLPKSTATFDVDQELRNKDSSVIVRTYGVIKDIEVINSGNNYQIGDFVTIKDPSGIDAVARVKSLKPSESVIDFNIINGGDNYRVGDKLVFTPINGGFGASAYVSQISNATVSNQCITTIETEQSIITDDVKDIKVEDYIKYQDFQIGSISKIHLVDGGRNYIEMPKISIYQKPLLNLPIGKGAEIEAISKNYGQITEIEIVNNGVGFKKSDIYPIIDLSNSGDGTATAKANIYAGIIKSKGYWKDNRGKLDSTIYLQDNYYYQDWSYIIKSSKSIKDYKDIVLDNIHLAGAQLFGQVNVNEHNKMHKPNEYNPNQFIRITYDQKVFGGFVNFNQLIDVNITDFKSYNEIYGSIYYIEDFKDYPINFYQDLELERFIAIYQDLLLGDIVYVDLIDILEEILSQLYGSTRTLPGYAAPADVTIRTINS